MIVNTNDNRTKSEYNKKCINCIWHKRYDPWNIWCECIKENGEKLYEDIDNRFGNGTVKNGCRYYQEIGKKGKERA